MTPLTNKDMPAIFSRSDGRKLRISLFEISINLEVNIMDNTTPMRSSDYDAVIESAMPFYTEFHRQTIDLVKTLKIHKGKWLDAGCGTCSLARLLLDEFPGFQYVLCDPSEAMIVQAKAKLSEKSNKLSFRICGSEQFDYNCEFDIITAIQSHHYLRYEDRVIATQNCYNALKQNGAFILFENFAPDSECGKRIALDRWGRYQKEHGKTDTAVALHRQRYGSSYFPISLREHFSLMSSVGFTVIEVFWLSYMQVGIYGIKVLSENGDTVV